MWETPFAMKRLAKLDNFIFAKISFLGGARLEVCSFFMENYGKIKLFGECEV